MSDILSYNAEVMIMGSMSIQQSTRLLVKPTMLAAALAAAAVLVVFVVGSYVFDASMAVTMGEETTEVVGGVAVGFAAVIVLLGGVAAAGLMSLVKAPARVFTIIAGTVFVLMAFGPITSSEDAATGFTLMAIHVAVLVPVIVLVRPVLRARDTGSLRSQTAGV